MPDNEGATMNKHKLKLMGGPHSDLRVSAVLLHEAIGTLIEGARLATRFAVEGESIRKGPRPTWLDSACAVDIVGLTAGSVDIAMEAPTLQEVDAARFGGHRQRSRRCRTGQRYRRSFGSVCRLRRRPR